MVCKCKASQLYECDVLISLEKCSFLVHFLSLLSIVNAIYTFTRKRHYRLFEQSIDAVPSTPSARRVRVDSSPISSSPLRFLSDIITSTTAESRAHPDDSRNVWEIAVWDPTPICLRLFCLFSPAHVLIYWSFLPLQPLDPRPSVTIVKTIFLATILSAQSHFLSTRFSQQSKDTSVISKQVLHEYDTKFVHPSLNHPVREVGTQTPPRKSTSTPTNYADSGTTTTEVDTYAPHIVINRGFRVNPNPAYAPQYDPDNLLKRNPPSRPLTTPNLRTAAAQNPFTSPASANPATDFSSPLHGLGNNANQIRPFPSLSPDRRGTTHGDGGSLGVYSHAASPLRKAASANYLRQASAAQQSQERGEQHGGRVQREGSPLKRMSMPGAEFQREGGTGLNQRLKALRGEGAGVRRESGRY